MNLLVTGSNPIEQARKHAALTELAKGDVEVLEFLADLRKNFPKSEQKLKSPLTQSLVKRACK